MAIPVQLFAMKTSTVKFTALEGSEEHDFSDHITNLTFNPSKGSSTPVVSGRKYSGKSSWSISLGLVQDLDQSGLLRFLMANDGKKMKLEVTFLDNTDTLICDVNIAPAGIGGAAGTDLPTSSVDLEVDGTPEWVPTGA